MIKETNILFIIKLLFFQALCVILGVGVGVGSGFYLELSKYNNAFYKNIIVAGTDVSHKTIPEATSLIEDKHLNNFLEKKLSVTLKDQSFEVPIKDLFIGSNLEDIIHTAFEYPRQLSLLEKSALLTGKVKQSFDLKLEFNHTAIDAFVQNIINQISSTPQNASISINKDKITINPHIENIVLDKNELIKAIEVALHSQSSLSIDATPFATTQIPSIQTSTLEAIDTLITSASTTFKPNTGSAHNIKLSSKVIDGTLLMPGDVFSFNQAVGDTTLEKGYKYAPIISNFQMIQGVGGGICQVSSTLYNAALQIGLGSLSRQPHSKPSNYVPLGLDATVSWGSIDYTFKNTLEYPIYIQSYTTDNTLYVNLYSNHILKDMHYKINSEVYEVLAPSSEYISDPSLPPGETRLIESGRKGYKVKVTREIYQKDKLKNTEVISYDTYRPSPAIYKKGK